MWRLILIGVLVAAVAGFVWRWQYLENENDRLNRELNSANATVQAQDDVIQKNREIEERENNAFDAIDAAPASDDGPVADVVRRAVAGLQNISQ